VQKLAVASDADKQFAEAIRRFGPVVLGNFFLYTDADIRGIDSATLDEYANQLGFFAFPQVIGTRQGFQKEDRIHLIEEFAAAGMLPKGAEANIAPLTPLGTVLFVLSRTARLSVERTTMAILPWLVPLFAALIVCTYVPEIVLWLPKHSAAMSEALSSVFR